jgi:hypothetical protein
MSHAEEIWNLLHDGGITDVEGEVPGDVTLRVEISYITDLLAPPTEAVLVTLVGCTAFEYRSWADDSTTTNIALLAAQEVDILSTSPVEAGVRVICSNGQFDIAYSGVQLARADHSALEIGEVDHAAIAYWEAFEKRRGV